MDDFLVHEQDATGAATHALVVGVGAYPHLLGGGSRLATDNEGMGQLTSPPESARAFARWLFNMRYHPKPLASLALLLSEEPKQSFSNTCTGVEYPVASATVEHVKDAIRAWKQRGDQGNSNSENRLIFFFSGHGICQGPDMALLLEDFGSDNDHSLSGALDFQKLFLGMDRCAAREQVFFVDACRATSDTMIAAQGYAGQVVVQPTSVTGQSRHREYSVYFSTLAGSESYGRPGVPSEFTAAVLAGLEGAGSDDSEGNWQVDTSHLQIAINYFMRKAVEEGAERRQVPEFGGTSTLFLHHLPHTPTVHVSVECRPVEAHAKARLSYTPRVRRPSRRGPASDPWELDLPAGSYRFAARFADTSYESQPVKRWVRPVYTRVPIEVSPCHD